MYKFSLFFFNDTATTEIYTLSLHDALPISECSGQCCQFPHSSEEPTQRELPVPRACEENVDTFPGRSEEHTSELQSHLNLVCRLLLEKKKRTVPTDIFTNTVTDIVARCRHL